MLLLCLGRPDILPAMLLIAAILLGLLSGFTIRRLSTRKKLGEGERKLLETLGWTLMSLWLVLAALLLLWAASSLLRA
jgi:hypothetical protein